MQATVVGSDCRSAVNVKGCGNAGCFKLFFVPLDASKADSPVAFCAEDLAANDERLNGFRKICELRCGITIKFAGKRDIFNHLRLGVSVLRRQIPKAEVTAHGMADKVNPLNLMLGAQPM